MGLESERTNRLGDDAKQKQPDEVQNFRHSSG
jgi:hypothetical protein